MAEEQQEVADEFGPNAWLVDELYEKYRLDPTSVSASWQEFFADNRPTRNGGSTEPAAPPAAAEPPPAQAAQPPQPAVSPPAPPAKPAKPAPAPASAGSPLPGAALRTAVNMEASLGVPTATSFRVVPARLLEVNRKVLNNHLARTRGGKVSFTHIIGYAVVQAVKAMPVMNRTFVPGQDGTPPSVIDNEHVNLGLAIDVTKSDGSHTLLVPVIKNADTLDFKQFVNAYEELIRKIKSNKISPDDFAGATLSLTNPGTIGTVQSVPR